MVTHFMFLPNQLVNHQAVTEIINCNEKSCIYGLVLSQKDANELVETRNESLNKNGRIEFGGSIIQKLINEFCSSPYLNQSDYADTLHELIETFYYLKNESLDIISDNELISLMKENFDKRCHGSIELLQGRELEKLAHNIRFSIDNYLNIEEDIDENMDDEEEFEE